MKKIIPYVLTAASLIPSGIEAKTLVTAVAAPEQSTQRVEVIEGRSGIEGYMVWEHTDSDFYKAKLSSLPVKAGPLSFGGVVQHVDGSDFEARQEAGLVGRIKSADGKLDVAYLPDSQKLESYAYFSWDRVMADVLSAYDLDDQKGFARPSIQYELGGVSIGLEAQTDFDSIDYAGVKVQTSF